MRFLFPNCYKNLIDSFMLFNDMCPPIYQIEICQSKNIKIVKILSLRYYQLYRIAIIIIH